ncbi:GNAT family N-acetyltransferase [Bifidobacterium biavatii]|uniref:GNAT family acetyltransferase n=1 Tax=Bifidobacterium biavatii DSM 23969 TaxID=1437608 RepID=A0A087A4Q0_9BIFI|nr:GNAT family N-acetyltransferase [Bifidobacterium biavatii]KFI53750.1 GNAT family acetyltransferase [Bifidobacterium biavatii DSM 23969]
MTSFSQPRRLTINDDVSGFDCGLDVVNNWLFSHWRISQRQGTAVAYATFDGTALVGFYTLSAYSMTHAESPGWLRRNSPNPIPVILLGILGVDIRYQTNHVGSQLLRDAVLRAMNAAAIIGARALVVEPATDKAAAFYEHYGFRHIKDSRMMFVPLPNNAA